MSQAIIEAALVELSRAKHGQKRSVVETLAQQLGVSVQTAYSRLQPAKRAITNFARKRRSDAGVLALNRDEAVMIAAVVEETRRKTGTGTLTVENAVDILRANGRIEAARVDEETGEFSPLSTSSICRALRHYGFHQEALQAPSPAARLSSPHPNYCWQIDASVSRQFYMADDGTRVMSKAEFYRGKPGNFQRISDKRLWRYATTDHASGAIEPFYVLGAESSLNLLSALIFAMTQRTDGTMHGFPKYLMADPGSAITASTTINFLDACGIELIINEVGNARAKGQVENGNKLIETYFEAGLKLRSPVTSLEEVNGLARQWARAFNATRIHTRTGMTRRDGWLRITPEQLAIAPAIDALRQVANSAPKLCTVRDGFVRFKGGLFDVRGIPGLINGQRINVIVNAHDSAGSVRALMPSLEESGRATHYIAARVGHDDWGFVSNAAQIGTEFKSLPETPADAARKEIERVAMQVQTDADAAAARKAKRLAFGGEVDPMKHLREAQIAPALPRAGTAATFDMPEVLATRRIEPEPIRAELAPLNHVEAAMRLKPLLERAGHTWKPEHYARTAARWPEGVPVDQVELWAVELTAPGIEARGGLRLITGGAA